MKSKMNLTEAATVSALLNYITMAQRRFGTVLRDNAVHEMYEQMLKELGDKAGYISRGYVYRKIGEKTHLSTRTISYILNHTRKRDAEFE